ncbi:hypothetical protein [Streptomyces sp. NPDC051567]|uniref:hypothetical protein n=1 Tax=Streptomyces sp. NPDC051567 TaxID=3365660 RepID=UPI0037A7DB9F
MRGYSGGLRVRAPAVTAAMLGAQATATATAMNIAAPTAHTATPGTPGVPQAPTVVYAENFENKVNGAADPTVNHAVSAYTDGANPGTNKVEFQTVKPIPLTMTNRYISFSVDAAANGCTSSAPLLQLLSDGQRAGHCDLHHADQPMYRPEGADLPQQRGQPHQGRVVPEQRLRAVQRDLPRREDEAAPTRPPSGPHTDRAAH